MWSTEYPCDCDCPRCGAATPQECKCPKESEYDTYDEYYDYDPLAWNR